MKKLVRDHIPEFIKRSGRSAVYYKADDLEYKTLLKQKLIEEVNEFIESENIEELADILEVVDAICINWHFDLELLLQIKHTKQQEKGGFKEKIVLTSNGKDKSH